MPAGIACVHRANSNAPALPCSTWPLTFAKPTDYDLVEEADRVSVTGLAELTPGKPVTVVLTKPGGKTVTIQCQHTLTDEQIGWFKAGSALNALT